MRDDHLALTALAGLDGIGPRRLARLVETHSPEEVVRRLLAHKPLGVPAMARYEPGWRDALAQVDIGRLGRRLCALGCVVSRPGDVEHPAALTTDLDPAPVLFRRGAPFVADCPAVAIIGTRRASGVGRDVARELGFELAAAGVTIVSGLALGIDGAAHEGALAAGAAPPLAFVGGGPDVVYPRRHDRLWHRVIEHGTLASEAPPGAPPTRWRFPARNRLIAAMCDLVVVVESRAAGGSLLTVDEAIRRGRDVMAVPGSVRNGAAAGTNTLIAEGCAPVMSADDVAMALGLSTATRASDRRARAFPELPADLQRVVEVIDDGATGLDTIVERAGLPAAAVLAAIGDLSGRGLVVDDGSQVRRV